MPTPTSRRAPAADALIEERDALCAELIALEREGQPRVMRVAAIEAVGTFATRTRVRARARHGVLGR